MISLAHDCLLFVLTTGEIIPFSAEMISVEVMGEAAGKFDPEVIRHAAASVFHYFRHDLARDQVTVVEFARVLEKVLTDLGYKVEPSDGAAASASGADLCALARESGEACELVFFPRLRHALQAQLQTSPRVIRFRGLRGCVKRLTGARRWSPRCETLREQILGYLNECLTADARQRECRLLVE